MAQGFGLHSSCRSKDHSLSLRAAALTKCSAVYSFRERLQLEHSSPISRTAPPTLWGGVGEVKRPRLRQLLSPMVISENGTLCGSFLLVIPVIPSNFIPTSRDKAEINFSVPLSIRANGTFADCLMEQRPAATPLFRVETQINTAKGALRASSSPNPHG